MTSIATLNGGMGNDEFLLGDNQFVYSENVDIYRDPRWVQLAVKPVNIVTDLPSLPTQILNMDGGTATGADRNTIFCLENKDVIDGEGTMRYQGSVLRPVDTYYRWVNAYMSFDRSIYLFDYVSGIMIPPIVFSPASNPTWQRSSSSIKDFTAYALNLQLFGIIFNGITRPIVRIGSSDFFTDLSDIYNIVQTSSSSGMDASGPFGPGYPHIESYAQGITQPGENVFMSVHPDNVWSISKYLNAIGSEFSALSFQAGVSNGGTKQLVINKNTRFIHGANKSGYDIVVAGDELSRGSSSSVGIPFSVDYACVYAYILYGFGADAQQLIARSRYHNNIEVAFGNHGITYYLIGFFGNTQYNWANTNEMLYCLSNKDNVGLIYAYGRTQPGYKDAWSVIVSKNSFGKKLKRIGCLYRHSSKNGFYYSYEDEDGVIGVDYYDDISIESPTSFQPSGKIFLRTDDGGDMSMRKEANLLKMGLYIPENTTAKISYIIDNNGVEIPYETVTHTWGGNTNSHKKWRGNKPITGFQCISWFIELTSTGTETPKFFNFNYELKVIQQ